MPGVRMCLLEGAATLRFLPALLLALEPPLEVLSAVTCSSLVQMFTAAALAASPRLSGKPQHLQTPVSILLLAFSPVF